MRYRTLFFVLPGLTMAIALTGCGSEQAGEAPAKSLDPGLSRGSESTAPEGETKLSVAYAQSPKVPVKNWTLTCEPVGGDHPQAKAACAALAVASASGKDPFAPVPKDDACTLIYGGPQTATVTGTWQGKQVNAQFSAKDGCQVKRWTVLAPLLGELPRPR